MTDVEVSHCGVIALAGRANVGKSTLLNAIAGRKVAIVSDKPQTTRNPVRTVLTVGRAQAVFVDTPGLHKARTLLGQRLNRTAGGAAQDADLIVQVVDGKAGAGGGDLYVAEHLPARHVCVVNKVDGLPAAQVLDQLKTVGEWGFDDYFPVSARTGSGVKELVTALLARLPEGRFLYPAASDGPAVADVDDRAWVGELVREQLLGIARDELPYSIACRVTDWDWPYIRCEILVERESQKGIVIGRGGSVLKRVGTAVRSQLPPGAYVELSVRVARDWQHKSSALERLGL
ncbi:MAG TPA: GTPase Era [Acidimicrobiales bacterium]|nr:GTPase Era [Acidimicrobiales bacterium]